MVDKIVRWFVEGDQSRIQQTIGGTHLIDGNYAPEWVHLSLKKAGNGDTHVLKVDITNDGVSIFEDKPALANNQADKVWTTIPGQVIRSGAILKLNRDQTFDLQAGEDLTVELGLTRN